MICSSDKDKGKGCVVEYVHELSECFQGWGLGIVDAELMVIEYDKEDQVPLEERMKIS